MAKPRLPLRIRRKQSLKNELLRLGGKIGNREIPLSPKDINRFSAISNELKRRIEKREARVRRRAARRSARAQKK